MTPFTVNKLVELTEDLNDEYEILKNWKYDDSSPKTLTWQEFEKNQGGTCYDYVNYLYFKYKELGPVCYHISYGVEQIEATHTFIMFPGRVVECAWKTHTQNKEYVSYRTVLEMYDEWMHKDHPKKYFAGIRQYVPDNK